MIQFRLGKQKQSYFLSETKKPNLCSTLLSFFCRFTSIVTSAQRYSAVQSKHSHICEICGSFCEKREKTIRFWKKELLYCKAVLGRKCTSFCGPDDFFLVFPCFWAENCTSFCGRDVFFFGLHLFWSRKIAHLRT